MALPIWAQLSEVNWSLPTPQTARVPLVVHPAGTDRDNDARATDRKKVAIDGGLRRAFRFYYCQSGCAVRETALLSHEVGSDGCLVAVAVHRRNLPLVLRVASKSSQ